MKPVYFFIAMGCILLIIGCATNSDLMHLENRLAYRLREQEDALSRQQKEMAARFGTNQDKLQDRSAVLGVDIEQLREEIQAVGGRADESQYRLEAKIKNLEAAIQKLSDQLDQVVSEKSAAAKTARPVLEPAGADGFFQSAYTGDPAAEQIQYDAAKNAFDAGDYETAKSEFSAFIKQYPASENADNAQFWVADIYYREKWYEKAILEYQQVIEMFPDGNKVPDALWKQGLSFLNLNEKVNARLIWEELVNKYPNAAQSELARQKLKTL